MKSFLLSLALISTLLSQAPYPHETARHSEEWVKNAIIYEIFPRSFSKEGNFAGIEKRLPELKKLGVTVLWLMPIHPIGEEKRKGTLGSPYSIKDYYGINPDYGTIDDFKELVSSAHQEGFKIIIDLVANHTSWDSKMFTVHPEWFTKDSAGIFIPPIADWSDVADLNYDNKELRHYMIDMLKFWVRDIGIDGFRCDVSTMVPTDFWNDARAALDSIKPIVMLSEGEYPEHHIKAFDLTYSWNFYSVMKKVIDGNRPPLALDSVLIDEAARYPKNTLRMRFSSNHDENAWDNPDVTLLGKDGAELAAVIVNTFPGVPLLYNGQEVGNDKKLELFEKININWMQGKSWNDFYTKLFALRKKNSALVSGTYGHIKNNREDVVYTFLRSDGKNNLLAAFNFASGERTAQLELPSEMMTKKFTNLFTGKKVEVKNVQKLILPAKGYRVFVVE